MFFMNLMKKQKHVGLIFKLFDFRVQEHLLIKEMFMFWTAYCLLVFLIHIWKVSFENKCPAECQQSIKTVFLGLFFSD